MSHLDEFAQHISPLATPLPHPDVSRRSHIIASTFPTAHPGPITMQEPRPWWRRVNWGFVALLASAAAVSGFCAWSLL